MQISIVLITISFILSFYIVYKSIPFLIVIAHKNCWMDHPTLRKVHKKPIPTLGGAAFFLSFWGLIYSLLYSFVSIRINYIFLASSILFMVSLWDDLYKTRAIVRLFLQVLVASVCFLGGIRVLGLYGIFGIGEVSTIFQYILTVFAILSIINAMNLIDGINGLASSIFIVATIVFVILFQQNGGEEYILLSVISLGMVLGFLPFNWGEAKIFMGDNGSTFLGLLLSVFFIEYINFNSGTGGSSSNLILGLGIIALPILDLIRVSISRLIQGKSPFFPDKNHIHHLYITRGKSHRVSTIQIVIIQFSCFLIALIMKDYFTPISIIMTLIIFYIVCISYLKLSINLTKIKNIESTQYNIEIANYL